MTNGLRINPRFHALLKECRDAKGESCTVGKLAQGIQSGRSHVSQVLNGKASAGQQFSQRRGGRTRVRLARYFKTTFPDQAPAILEALGWDENGQIVPRGDVHVEHPV